MKNAVKIAVVSILAQAALAAAAGAEEARPIAVDIRVEAGSGGLSEKASAISEALMDGDSAGADQLLADLYSGGLRKEEAVPVQASKCCCQQAPAVAVAVSTAAASVPAAVAPADPYANDPISQFIKAEEAKKAEAEAKAKEKKEEAEEEAKKQKQFNWGVTIMTIALLLLLIL